MLNDTMNEKAYEKAVITMVMAVPRLIIASAPHNDIFEHQMRISANPRAKVRQNATDQPVKRMIFSLTVID
jgi:hypothetical protein